MGGNAFPGKTRRYDAAEYHTLVPKVLEIVETFSSKCSVIPAYANKPSFGDMDIVFVPKMPVNKDLLQAVFECGTNVIHNGDVWSLVHREFQIDLINTPAKEFAAALNYFRYNDMGNLKGRIFHKMGLKFGHDGLWFPVRSNDHVLGEILLTLDPAEIDAFGNYAHPCPQINDLVDVFNVVVASKYFNPDIYLLENRNHVSRTRDRKRATYAAFLEWCKQLPPDRTYYQFDRDKTVYHRKIFKAFPHAKPQFDELWRRKLLVEQAATMFNGDLVREWTGREGVELGNLMKVVKAQLPPEVVVEKTHTELYNIVMHAHNVITV